MTSIRWPLAELSSYTQVREALYTPALARTVVERLWKGYQQTGNPRYGEWSQVWAYIWWRCLPNGPERVQAAQLGQKLSQSYIKKHPQLVAGHQWQAIHTGTEILARGVLDGLHLVPALRRDLERSIAIDPTYFYGLPSLILAKVLVKLPPFPVSVGDPVKARAMLEELRPLCEGKFAIWYLFLAEAELLAHGPTAMDAVLDRMAPEVKPVNLATRYLLESGLQDAEMLKQRVRQANWNRYTWDFLLEPARPA